MSRTISAALEAHLAGEVLTVATLWKVTRTDGEVFGFTDHDQDISYSSVTYDASTGYTRSAARSTLGLAVDNLDVDGALDSSTITAADLRAGVWDHAVVEIFLINYADTSMGVLQIGKGKIGEVRAGRSAFRAELRGLAQHLQQSILRLYVVTCNADLGDSRCGVDLNGSPGLTVTGSITLVSSKRAFQDSSRTETTGYFDGGKITWLTGNNADLTMEVKTYTLGSPNVGEFTLQLPMPYTIQIGDTYSLFAGCDKTFATCKSKFSNGDNFRGFPHIPGIRRMVTGGR